MIKINEDNKYVYYELSNKEINDYEVIRDNNLNCDEFIKNTNLNENILRINKYEGYETIINYLNWCIDSYGFKIVSRKYKLLKIKNKL